MRRETATLAIVFTIGSSLMGCGQAIDNEGTARPSATSSPGLGPPVEPRVTVSNGPAEAIELIKRIAAELEVSTVTAVEFGDPPTDEGYVPLEGYPGSKWLYIDVNLDSPSGMRVVQDWEASRLAGAIRNEAAEASLPIPFGYSIIGRLAEGSTVEPVTIIIGADLGTSPRAVDPTATATAVRAAARSLALRVTNLEFRGSDRALVVRAASERGAADALDSWPELLRGLVGSIPASAWLVEIDDAAGLPLRAMGNSPATAGAVGWIRPDLQVRVVDDARGRPTDTTESSDP